MDFSKLALVLTFSMFTTRIVMISGTVPPTTTCNTTIKLQDKLSTLTKLVETLRIRADKAATDFSSYVGFKPKPFRLGLYISTKTSLPDWWQKTEQDKLRSFLVKLSIFRVHVHTVWTDLETKNSGSSLNNEVFIASSSLNAAAQFIENTLRQMCGSSSLPTIQQLSLVVLTQKTQEFLDSPFGNPSLDVVEVRDLAILYELTRISRDLQNDMKILKCVY